MPDDCPSGFYFSSIEPTVDMPLNDSMMQENDDNEQISTLQDYNLGIEGKFLEPYHHYLKKRENKMITIRNHP